MAWTTPATATAGTVLTAAWLNTYVRDNETILKTSIDNNGHIVWQLDVYTTNHTLGPANDVVIAFNVTISLPATPVVGKPFLIKAAAASTVTVSGNGNTIDGASTFILNPYDAATFVWNTSEYSVF